VHVFRHQFFYQPRVPSQASGSFLQSPSF
jgi:hypothetical protein